MLDPATARLCVWRLPLEAAFRLFSKLGSLGGSIRERFSRTGRTRPALARPAFSRWLLENDRLRERWPCQWLNVLYFPFSETSPCKPKTLKMSAYGTFSPTARPPRVLPTPWALPTPAFATWQGCREKPPAPLPQSVGSPPTCKGQAASGCFASLDRSPAPSASVNVAMFTEVERGQGRRSRRAFYP